MNVPESWLRSFCNPSVSGEELAECRFYLGASFVTLGSTSDARRRYYRVTKAGRAVAAAQTEQMALLVVAR